MKILRQEMAQKELLLQVSWFEGISSMKFRRVFIGLFCSFSRVQEVPAWYGGM